MISHRTIRPFLAGLMLALFALGITPKIAIHALVAHHTDQRPASGHGSTDLLSTAGYHCSIDNLVVQAPFLDHNLSIQLEIRPSFPLITPAPLEEPLSSTHPLFGLRGPPASFLS